MPALLLMLQWDFEVDCMGSQFISEVGNSFIPEIVKDFLAVVP